MSEVKIKATIEVWDSIFYGFFNYRYLSILNGEEIEIDH